MRSSFIEKLAYGLVSIAAGAVIAINIYSLHLTAQGAPAFSQASRLPTSPLNLESVSWAAGSRNLVLALSTTCHFCSQSAPFYRDLVAFKQKHPQLKLIAVFPQSVAEGREYLDNEKITVDTVVSASLYKDFIEGTPTLFLVDQHGKIKQQWVGLLSTGQQRQTFAALVNIL